MTNIAIEVFSQFTHLPQQAILNQLGSIPDLISPDDARPAAQQFAANYRGGWYGETTGQLNREGHDFVPLIMSDDDDDDPMPIMQADDDDNDDDDREADDPDFVGNDDWWFPYAMMRLPLTNEIVLFYNRAWVIIVQDGGKGSFERSRLD